MLCKFNSIPCVAGYTVIGIVFIVTIYSGYNLISMCEQYIFNLLDNSSFKKQSLTC